MRKYARSIGLAALLGVSALLGTPAGLIAQHGYGPPGGPAAAQRGGHGHGAMMGDAAGATDMQLFHALLDHRQEITRTVTKLADGVDTVTESDNPEVTRMIQVHVASMLARVEEGRPIHQRDPLFREIFRNAEKIQARWERTAKGVRVVETSADPWVVKLIQAHADVLDAFIANGHAEVMKNHPVPER
jgi:hypothetical protein